jgi:hypothetical protein
LQRSWSDWRLQVKTITIRLPDVEVAMLADVQKKTRHTMLLKTVA